MKRVLVVDDYPHLRETISEILQVNGYDVITANDGQMGVQLACQYVPDLILCDVNMPLLNGYEVTLELYANATTTHIPILMLTGDTDNLRDKYTLRDNIQGYIIKPFEALTLLSTVERHLGNV